jgi:Metallo-peptidase family M12B Reprolysin-like/SprB repeat
MSKHFAPLFFLVFYSAALAQNPWSEPAARALPTAGVRDIVPDQYRAVQLDFEAMKTLLCGSALPNPAPVEVWLPLPDGRFGRFRAVETPVMAPALQARYPDIRCFSGVGLDDPGASVKMNISPQGFQASVQSDRGTILIDPYIRADRRDYMAYDRDDFFDPRLAVRPACADPLRASDIGTAATERGTESADGFLRRYRLAISCTGEYVKFHGGTTAGALAALNNAVNRLNQVYERDFSISFQLVARNDTLIFTDPATDPFTNNDGFAMMGENTTVCNERLGTGQFDIAHVFSTWSGGGVAGLRTVCTNSKARGATGSTSPTGDRFVIDYAAHEIGHQFGGNHTQNNDNCNRSNNSAVEPGSGSTIMGYAGVCSPSIQSRSDDYFHGISVGEINRFITAGAGNNCPVKIETGNRPPAVGAGRDYVIPRLTPFALTGTAEDADGDTLTYCWEQMDNEVGKMPPQSNNQAGPMFRSRKPATTSTRVFPQMSVILLNSASTWERLPAVGRPLKFQFTVRDNNAGGGVSVFDNMTLTVAGNAGPFAVKSPNTALTWYSGENQVVAWDVAGTDTVPVLCPYVRIRLSANGGNTFPFILADSVPNNGSFEFTVPEILSDACRVLIEGYDNVFFDVSNANFKIESGLTRLIATAEIIDPVVCHNAAQGRIAVYATGGAPGPYQYSLNGGLPQTSNIFSGLAPGKYVVTASNGSGITARTDTIRISNPEALDFSANFIDNSLFVNALGGSGPYEYSLDSINWKNKAIFVDLLENRYKVRVRDANGCVVSKTVDRSVGTAETLAEWGLTFGPNPGAGLFELRFERMPTQLQARVFNAGGQLVHERAFERGDQTVYHLDLRDQAPGLYVLRLTDGPRAGSIRVGVLR